MAAQSWPRCPNPQISGQEEREKTPLSSRLPQAAVLEHVGIVSERRGGSGSVMPVKARRVGPLSYRACAALRSVGPSLRRVKGVCRGVLRRRPSRGGEGTRKEKQESQLVLGGIRRRGRGAPRPPGPHPCPSLTAPPPPVRSALDWQGPCLHPASPASSGASAPLDARGGAP